MKNPTKFWRFNALIYILVLGFSVTPGSIALEAHGSSSGLATAEIVTAVGRLMVIPANRAELLGSNRTELLQLFADGFRLSNGLLSLYGRSPEGWHYKGAWAARDALHMSKTIHDLFAKKSQIAGQQQLSLNVDSKKLNNAIFYLRSYLLPVTETAAATLIALGDSVVLDTPRKRVAIESVMSLSRLFSDYLLTNKKKVESKIYEAALFVHSVLTIREFWKLFGDNPTLKDRQPTQEDKVPTRAGGQPAPADEAPVEDDEQPAPEDKVLVEDDEQPTPEDEAPVGDVLVEDAEKPAPADEAPVDNSPVDVELVDDALGRNDEQIDPEQEPQQLFQGRFYDSSDEKYYHENGRWFYANGRWKGHLVKNVKTLKRLQIIVNRRASGELDLS